MQLFGMLQTALIEILTRAGSLVSGVLEAIQKTDAVAGANELFTDIVNAIVKSIS